MIWCFPFQKSLIMSLDQANSDLSANEKIGCTFHIWTTLLDIIGAIEARRWRGSKVVVTVTSLASRRVSCSDQVGKVYGVVMSQNQATTSQRDFRKCCREIVENMAKSQFGSAYQKLLGGWLNGYLYRPLVCGWVMMQPVTDTILSLHCIHHPYFSVGKNHICPSSQGWL